MDNTPASPPAFANADQALIHRFLAGGGAPLRIDSNPMAVALGMTLLRVDRDIGEVEIAFAPEPLFIQGLGVLQGGAVAAMLDFAMGFVTLATIPIGQSCATVNLNTAFLRAAPLARYHAVGSMERRGRALAFTHARLFREHDQLVVATATSTLAVTPANPA